MSDAINTTLSEIQIAQAASVLPSTPAPETDGPIDGREGSSPMNEGTHGLVEPVAAEPVIAAAPEDGFDPDAVEPAAGPAAAGGGGATASFSAYDPGFLGGGREAMDLLGYVDMTTTPLEGLLGVHYGRDDGVSGRDANLFLSGAGAGYENLTPMAHIGDYTVQTLQLNVTFTPLNGSSLVSITITLPGGVGLSIGNPNASPVYGTVVLTPAQLGDLYLHPVDYSDADLSITAVAVVNDRFGAPHTLAPVSFVVVIDAVAQMPENVSGTLVDDGSSSHSMSETVTESSRREDGFDKTDYRVTAGPAEAIVDVSFDVTAVFQDFDGSEQHFVLVEKLPGFTGSYETIEIGGVSYFQIPVDNAQLAANSGTVTMTVILQSPQTTVDTDFSVRTGAMALETPVDAEITTDNNVSVVFDPLGVDFTINVINSALSIETGWASEGNAPDKNVAAGSHAEDWISGDVSNATAAGGAPVNLVISDPDSDEEIASIRFSFDVARGELVYDPNDFPAGTVFDDQGGVLTITFPTGSNVDGIVDKIYFQPAGPGSDGYFNQTDVALDYEVVVQNSDGASATYRGTSTVVIDAVADRPVLDPTTDDSVTYNVNNGIEQQAAKPGETVTLTARVSFPDTTTEGAEDHFILIRAQAGVVYESITIGATTYTATDIAGWNVNAQGYFEIPIDRSLSAIDVSINVNATASQDTIYRVEVGGKATVDGSDGEYDTGNNEAVTIKELSFEVAPANSTTTIRTVDTYESSDGTLAGIDPNKHWKGDSRPGTDPHVEREIAANGGPGTRTGEYSTISVNMADLGTITFALGSSDSRELITRVNLTIDGDLNDLGTLELGGVTIPAWDGQGATPAGSYYTVSGGITTVVIVDATPSATSLSIRFVPSAWSDVNLVIRDYQIDFVNEKSFDAGSTGTLTGIGGAPVGTVVVDSVAARAENLIVDQPDYNGDQTAAKLDEQLAIGFSFHVPELGDTNETHSLMLKSTPTNTGVTGGSYDRISLLDSHGTVVLSIAFDNQPTGSTQPQWIEVNGVTYTLVGGVFVDGTGTVSDMTVTKVYMDGNIYYKISGPAFEDYLTLVDGDVDGALDITAPSGLQTGSDGSCTVGSRIGVLTEDRDSDGGLTEKNDGSYIEKHYTYTVETVGSTVGVSVGHAYENADDDAHLGFIPRAQLSDAELKAGGAAISVNFDQKGNEEITQAVFRVEYGNDDTVPGQFMYKDQLITIPSSGMIDGDGYTCSVDANGTVTLIIDGFDARHNGEDSLYFIPAENYLSTDVALTYAITVHDSASDQDRVFTNDSSMLDDTSLFPAGQYPGGWQNSSTYTDITGTEQTILVDAVAQQAVITTEVEGMSGFRQVVPGSQATIHMDVDVRGDVTDGSESHYLYVQTKKGFSVDSLTITYLGTDGDDHTITVSGDQLGLGSYGGSIYATYDLALDTLNPPAASGGLTIDVILNTPSGVGASETITVGVLTQEEWSQIQKDGDRELDLGNNQSVQWNDVEILFSTCSRPSLDVEANFYENSTKDAHTGDQTRENYAVPLAFTTGDANDALIGFNLALDSNSADLGTLYLFITQQDYADYLDAVNGGANPYDAIEHYAVSMGDSISLVDLEAEVGPIGTGNFGGQIVFMPEKESYSGQDPLFEYTITLQDTDSGQVQTISSDTVGKLSIVADSVAQRPEDLHVADKSGDADLGLGEERVVTVSATFTDLDGSSQHYILIEALAGWTVTVDGRIYGPGDTVSFEEGGRTYYRIPVTPTPDSSDPNVGTASIDVSLTAPTEHIFLHNPETRDYSFAVKAGSADTSEGYELTFHNNTAVIDAGSISGSLTGSHSGIWTFEQVNSVYEDNRPYQYLSDQQAQDQFGVSANSIVGGTFVVGYNDSSVTSAVITVPLDGNGNSKLELSGAGVHYVGNGVYSIDLSGGAVEIDVRLGADYLTSGGGANTDDDLSFESVAFLDAGGNTVFNVPGGSLGVVVDAVADRNDVSVTSREDAGKGTTAVDQDAVAAHISGKGSDAVAMFTVSATFNDVDGSERHYVLVEKIPEWEPSSSYAVDEVYIDGKAYYRFDVTDSVTAGVNTFEIGMAYLGGGIYAGDDLFGSYDEGVASYDLIVGSMSQETNTTDTEFNLQNNTAVNLDDSVTLKYSPINSSGAMDISHSVIEEGSHTGVTLTLSGIATDQSDILIDLAISYTQSEGQLYLVDDSGNRTAISSGYSSFTSSQLAGLSEGTWTFVFEADEHTHNDVDFSWTGTVKDTVSDASQSISGSKTVVIDAVADGSINDQTVVYDAAGQQSAALSGQSVTVVIKADFADNVNTSEEHWVVLEQKLGYGVVDVQISTDGVNWTSFAGEIVTISADGKSYFAVQMPDSGDYDVKYVVTTPEVDRDTSVTLNAGTIVVETTKNSAGNSEPDYSNNWTSDIAPIEIRIGVVDTTHVSSVRGSTEEDISIAFNITLEGGQNEEISRLVVNNPPAGGQGEIWYDGSLCVVEADGTIVIADASGTVDPGKIEFRPADNWKGTYTFDYTATVTDLASGARKDFNGSFGVSVTPVTDTPEGASGAADNPVEQSGHVATVAITLSADFIDYSGTEKHFFLVTLPDGAETPAGWRMVTDMDLLSAAGMSGTVYMVSAAADGTASFTITIPENFAGDDLLFRAGSYEEGVNPPVYEFSDAETTFIAATGAINEDPTAANQPGSSVVGGVNEDVLVPLYGTFVMDDDDGDTVTLTHAGALTLVFDPANEGYAMIAGDYGVLYIKENGDYKYVLTDEHAQGTEDFQLSFNDGHNGTGTASLEIAVDYVNHAPEAVDAVVSFVDNGSGYMEGQLSFSDEDSSYQGDALSVVKVTVGGVDYDVGATGWTEVEGEYGTMNVNAQGAYRYIPNDPGAAGSLNAWESFSFVVEDQYGLSDSATLNVALGSPVGGLSLPFSLASINIDSVFDALGVAADDALSGETARADPSVMSVTVGSTDHSADVGALDITVLAGLEVEYKPETL